jgi:toxin-antitoxin system PIN domain toxin
MPWHSLLAFLRVSTNPRVFGRPLSIGSAWEQVLEWIDHPQTWIPEPTDDHAEVLGKILTGMQITAKLIPDAHLAAIAIEHGLTVCSADADFARFPGVTWVNPLANS